jgi:hypothetical protein
VKSWTSLSPAAVGILILTLIASALGGTTELWQQALVACLTAILLLIAPPRLGLGRAPALLLAALFVLALAAFLPAAWASAPPWRRALTDLSLTLPGTRTAQPWLTAQSCGLLLVGLVWTAYILSQKWNADTRRLAVQALIGGMAFLAALAVAAFCLGFHVPTWNQEENRGWFPNRNQTADVLAICGVINYALVSDCLRKGRASLYLWLATLAAIGAALVISYSRAGILLFFGGILLWHLWPVPRSGKGPSAIKWMTLSLAVVFVLLTLFFLFGGETLARFEGGPTLHARGDANFRWAIQSDALRFSLQSPWLGVGLGNFEPLFASARHASANAERAVHPESDWLWAACELGWFAPVLFFAGIVWWLRQCLPFENKPGESLRRALVVAGVLFILHGLVDVGGHRLGSLWIGLLVFSLAMRTTQDGPGWPPAALLFRMLALVLLLISGWWGASVQGAPVPPTTSDLARLQNRMDRELAANQLAALENLANAGLKIAPLDWHFYFQRAYAETFQTGKLAQAGADFKVVRTLEPTWVKPCFDEGATWFAAGQPDLCMDAWQEALRRATPAEFRDYYLQMVQLSLSNDLVHEDLLELAAGKVDDELIFLNDASNDETKRIVADILSHDPDLRALDAAQREKLFTVWWTLGDRPALLAAFQAHPDWLMAGWPILAQSYADQKDFQNAWETVARYSPAPAIPSLASDQPLADLERGFYEQPDNLAAGIMLYREQNKEGKTDDALATLRSLEKLKSCPKYVFYLEAQLWAAKQQWELAWTAWQNFHAT